MRNAPPLSPDLSTYRARDGRERQCFPHVVAVVLLSSLAACARQDVKSELDRTRSWTATTHLAADRREAHATNGAITSQLLDRARDARSQAERSLGQLAKSDSERAAARGLLDSLSEGIAQLRKVAP